MDGVEGNGQTVLTDVNCIIDTSSTLVVGDPSRVGMLYDVLCGTDASNSVGQGYYAHGISPGGGGATAA